MFDDVYMGQAPERVGLGQYPGGAELYAELARIHVTIDLTPAQFHQSGLERMVKIKEEMQALRNGLNFSAG